MIDSIKRITDRINETIDRRRIEKKTFFNDGWTILAILVSYLTYSYLGPKSLFTLAFIYVSIEFVFKATIDVTCWFLQISGLTHSLILTGQKKLKKTLRSTIAASIVIVYLIICTAIFTLFFVMIALDIKKLQQASMGHLRLDRFTGIVDIP